MLDTINEVSDELNEYKGKWRNLYFLKNGGVIEGNTLCSTEQEAEKLWQNYFATSFRIMKTNLSGDCRLLLLSERAGRDVYQSEVSHAIPMPVGE